MNLVNSSSAYASGYFASEAQTATRVQRIANGNAPRSRNDEQQPSAVVDLSSRVAGGRFLASLARATTRGVLPCRKDGGQRLRPPQANASAAIERAGSKIATLSRSSRAREPGGIHLCLFHIITGLRRSDASESLDACTTTPSAGEIL